ncbi:hypothetical protein AAFF_G00141880 [Aldrovandia affinis]|uniref:Uncharacterized protein n=1 Tax=Aldrovandia affinis TaxID=143900 RepID=A0AAD7TCM7_9TELE|nr:hypothetical protein AAFF_G00141880 [Aldrovandia affinis]
MSDPDSAPYWASLPQLRVFPVLRVLLLAKPQSEPRVCLSILCVRREAAAQFHRTGPTKGQRGGRGIREEERIRESARRMETDGYTIPEWKGRARSSDGQEEPRRHRDIILRTADAE